jgi:hypothetical protein
MQAAEKGTGRKRAFELAPWRQRSGVLSPVTSATATFPIGITGSQRAAGAKFLFEWPKVL